jgi:hypothetical protein
MGFLDNDGDVYIDATLTDLGRQRVARNDGTFSIVKFRLGDDEVDYRNWNELTGSDSKDRKILDSPVFEAFSNEVIALRYPLITIRNARLQYLPKLVSKPTSVTLREQVDSVGGGAEVLVSQEMSRAQTVLPAEIIDLNYIIELDNDICFVSNVVPVSITSFGTASYVIPATQGKVTSAGGTECKFNLRVQTLSAEMFDTLVGSNVAKPRTISTTVTVRGQQSGMVAQIPISIVEYATS